MNSLHSFRRNGLEDRVTAIILGLTLITAGNGIALVKSDEFRDSDKTSESLKSAQSTSDEAQAIVVSPNDIHTSPTVSTQLVSRPKPITEILLDSTTVVLPSSRPSPAESRKALIPKPMLKSAPKPPLAALKKAPRHFTMAEIRPMSDTTKNNLDKMELSVEDYQSYVAGIDTSHLDFTQQYTPFNPNKVAIEQRQSEFFTLHFTAFYSNFGESSKTEPVGTMDVRKLITTMGSRGDICCGINWILDRDGKTFQTAPVDAKLRHNPPYDSITTGVEVEASDQDAVTTKQYEALTYLTIAVLKQQGLLDKELAQVIHGHGEDRDKLRQANPESKWETRNDFDASVAKYFRSKVGLFLEQNPTVRDSAVSLR